MFRYKKIGQPSFPLDKKSVKLCFKLKFQIKKLFNGMFKTFPESKSKQIEVNKKRIAKQKNREIQHTLHTQNVWQFFFGSSFIKKSVFQMKA